MNLEELPERDMFGARPGEYLLPDSGFFATCASCHAPILWIRPGGGKAIALSVATVEKRADGKCYVMPHSSDCPKVEEWS